MTFSQKKQSFINEYTRGTWLNVANDTKLILNPAPKHEAATFDENTYQITLNNLPYSDTYWLSDTTLILNNYNTFELLGLDEYNLYLKEAYNRDNNAPVFHFRKQAGYIRHPIEEQTSSEKNFQIARKKLQQLLAKEKLLLS